MKEKINFHKSIFLIFIQKRKRFQSELSFFIHQHFPLTACEKTKFSPSQLRWLFLCKHSFMLRRRMETVH